MRISNLSNARGTCPANAGNTGVIPKDRILKYNYLEKKIYFSLFYSYNYIICACAYYVLTFQEFDEPECVYSAASYHSVVLPFQMKLIQISVK